MDNATAHRTPSVLGLKTVSKWSIELLMQLTNMVGCSAYSALFAVCLPNLASQVNQKELMKLTLWSICPVERTKVLLLRCPSQRAPRGDSKLRDKIEVSQHSIMRALQLLMVLQTKLFSDETVL